MVFLFLQYPSLSLYTFLQKKPLKSVNLTWWRFYCLVHWVCTGAQQKQALIKTTHKLRPQTSSTHASVISLSVAWRRCRLSPKDMEWKTGEGIFLPLLKSLVSNFAKKMLFLTTCWDSQLIIGASSEVDEKNFWGNYWQKCGFSPFYLLLISAYSSSFPLTSSSVIQEHLSMLWLLYIQVVNSATQMSRILEVQTAWMDTVAPCDGL